MLTYKPKENGKKKDYLLPLLLRLFFLTKILNLGSLEDRVYSPRAGISIPRNNLFLNITSIRIQDSFSGKLNGLCNSILLLRQASKL